jgi:hypothetical protein
MNKKFGSGGRTRPDVQKVNKSKTDHGKMTFFKEGGDTMAKMNAGMMAMMAKKKAGAKSEMPMKKMAGGGMPMKDGKPAFIGDGKGMKHGGMANGGSASKRADGVATKGKTKGTMIGMKMGGKAC